MIQGNGGPKRVDRGRRLALRGEPMTALLVNSAEPRMMLREQCERVVSWRKASETALANCAQEQRIAIVRFMCQQRLGCRQRLRVATLTHQGTNGRGARTRS